MIGCAYFLFRLRHQPLLQQILGHLYLLRRARDGDDTIVRVWQGLVDGDVRTGLVADATDAATSLTNDGTSQLKHNEHYIS